MSTTLPSDASKANCDSSADDPKLALLTDLAGLVDKYNALKAALGSLAQMAVGSGLELEVSGGAVADLLRSSMKETALAVTTTVTATHRARLLACTTSMTLNLTAASALGDGWWCAVRNAGSGTVTIDPSVSELIDGVATLALAPGESAIIACNGSAIKTVGRDGALASRVDALVDPVTGNGLYCSRILNSVNSVPIAGTTVSGANLREVYADGSGVLIATTTALTGTWRFVSLGTISAGQFATFQRIV